jgi:hypothetical protein
MNLLDRVETFFCGGGLDVGLDFSFYFYFLGFGFGGGRRDDYVL